MQLNRLCPARCGASDPSNLQALRANSGDWLQRAGSRKKAKQNAYLACLALALWPFGVERGPGDGCFARRGAYEGG
jgi:hypothetical protein